ncbi:MAG: hypothetical protein WBM13_08445, partial [Bacteroidia bacterium]
MHTSILKSLKLITIILTSVTIISTLQAQNISVNSTGALPHPSAMLDVVSANKGLLLPRVS